MQADAIKPGQNVVVIDDLIATGECWQSFFVSRLIQYDKTQGGSAKAAGELVAKLEGKMLEYMFIAEIKFLEGSSKLDAPTYSVIQVEDAVEDSN